MAPVVAVRGRIVWLRERNVDEMRWVGLGARRDRACAAGASPLNKIARQTERSGVNPRTPRPVTRATRRMGSDSDLSLAGE